MAEELSIKKLSITKYVIYLLLLVVFFGGLFYWLIKNINSQVAQVQEKRAHLSALEERDSSYKKMQSDFEEIKVSYSIIDQALPGQDNFISLIIALESNAKENQVNLNIKFPEEPQVQANMLSFQIEVGGNQKNVIKYLESLKEEPYFINIESLTLAKVGSRDKVAGEATIKVGVDETFSPDQISN